MSKTKTLPKFARCEDCKRKVFYRNTQRSLSWSQIGVSRWGKKYCPDGLAWHCGCQVRDEMRRQKEYEIVYARARKISESKKWVALLRTTRDRVRFEDGYVHGWFAHKKEMAARNRAKKK